MLFAWCDRHNTMRMPEIIEKKRDGFELSDAEIDFVIEGLVADRIPDYQIAAWMMAICWRGMTERETASLTRAMMYSGDVVDLSDIPGVKVDKHSTGGVGDTTTLVIAPLVAACGGTVAKMSGRGLAHSGGTLDKLESVPGVCVEQSMDDFKRIVREIGVAVIGQSGNLDPADKRMYALRDVTATVQSIPLIASSIMSKKLAAGADAIVLDVKMGNGAFMQTLEDARKLAASMVSIGKHVGRKTVAVITDMNRPLGMAVGNGLEMKEAIDVLSGQVPFDDPLVRVCMTLGSYMLTLAGVAKDAQEAEAMLSNALVSGVGLKKLRDMLVAMGGDPAYVDAPERLVQTSRIIPVYPNRSGYVGCINAQDIGLASCMLGAGRESKSDSVDPAVGILMKKRYGDRVDTDEPYAVLYVNSERRLDEAMQLLDSAISICDEKPEELPMIYDVIE